MPVVTTPSLNNTNTHQSAATSPRDEYLKQTPATREDRERINASVREAAAEWDRSKPLHRTAIEKIALTTLQQLDLPETYLGWTMVRVGSEFWSSEVAAVPHYRRVLMLPHCMRSTKECSAIYDEIGLHCESCGACSLQELRERAESLGYRVLIAEGSPIVMQLILTGQADAVLGVGCLPSLEKSLDKLLSVGLPGLAVPLLTSDCRDTTVDLDDVREMIETPFLPKRRETETWIHLLREAHNLFQPETFFRHIPLTRSESSTKLGQAEIDSLDISTVDPIAATEQIACDFLLRGGKHFRPFITLAAYDAASGGQATRHDGPAHVDALPDSVKRVAMAMEIFHKASLVHDDIEDDDSYRYGSPTLHHQYGLPTAINIGDYLIGLGYRTVLSQHERLPSEAIADVAQKLGAAHTRLSEGQGAELIWRDARNKRLAPIDALKIYALKTAPAFEISLYAGLRLAGPVSADLEKTIRQYSRHLGVAFQIENDLDDWTEDVGNKKVANADLLGGRPTILWALVLKSLPEEEQSVLCSLVDSLNADVDADSDPDSLSQLTEQIAAYYDQANVRDQALALLDKHARRARDAAESLDDERLSQLLLYFVDTILGSNAGLS
jgi:geranylgeranyl diphosphate synthase, type II